MPRYTFSRKTTEAIIVHASNIEEAKRKLLSEEYSDKWLVVYQDTPDQCVLFMEEYED